MTAQIVDLASYRAAKQRAERTQTERVFTTEDWRLPAGTTVLVDETDGFSREELVDLRKIFQEE